MQRKVRYVFRCELFVARPCRTKSSEEMHQNILEKIIEFAIEVNRTNQIIVISLLFLIQCPSPPPSITLLVSLFIILIMCLIMTMSIVHKSDKIEIWFGYDLS